MKDLDVVKSEIQKRAIHQKRVNHRQFWTIAGSCMAAACSTAFVLFASGFLFQNNAAESTDYKSEYVIYSDEGEIDAFFEGLDFENIPVKDDETIADMESTGFIVSKNSATIDLDSYQTIILYSVGTQSSTMFSLDGNCLINEEGQIAVLNDSQKEFLYSIMNKKD